MGEADARETDIHVGGMRADLYAQSIVEQYEAEQRQRRLAKVSELAEQWEPEGAGLEDPAGSGTQEQRGPLDASAEPQVPHYPKASRLRAQRHCAHA